MGVHMGVGGGRGGGGDQTNQMCETILPLVDSLCMLLKAIFLNVMAFLELPVRAFVSINTIRQVVI